MISAPEQMKLDKWISSRNKGDRRRPLNIKELLDGKTEAQDAPTVLELSRDKAKTIMPGRGDGIFLDKSFKLFYERYDDDSRHIAIQRTDRVPSYEEVTDLARSLGVCLPMAKVFKTNVASKIVHVVEVID